MAATSVRKEKNELVIELRVPVSANFLDFEKQVRDELTNAGRLLTERGLKDFDADGSAIVIGNTKYTAKQKAVEKKYETPFGPVKVERYAYQSSAAAPPTFRWNTTLVSSATRRRVSPNWCLPNTVTTTRAPCSRICSRHCIARFRAAIRQRIIKFHFCTSCPLFES